MPSADNIFHSNLHHLLSEANVLLGFSTITACWADIVTGLANTSLFIWPPSSCSASRRGEQHKWARPEGQQFQAADSQGGKRMFYLSSMKNAFFSSCPAISYRSRSIQLCTKWHSNAQGQRWHLRELQLLWNRLKWLPWIASREKVYWCHPHSQTEKKASLSV